MNARLTFVERREFNESAISLIRREMIGLYFISLREVSIPYPFSSSKLIYIGMSESSQHTIARRLRGHLSGQSGNIGISNYSRRTGVWFTHLSLEVLSVLGSRDIREWETFFLTDFVRVHGCYPICNGQAGAEYPESKLPTAPISVAWDTFQQ